LAWDLTQLNIGRIGVVSAPVSQPAINYTAWLANNVVLAGNGGVSNMAYLVLTSTNLIVPVSNWTVLSTNTFDAAGNFRVTNQINPGAQQQFYLLRLQ
jgi:hypothetical protein